MPVELQFDIEGARAALDVLLEGLVRDLGADRARNQILIPALRPFGQRINRRIRRLTPRSSRAPTGRRHLADTVRGRIRRERDGNVSFYGGYRRGKRTGVRFQQVLAVTYGARGRQGRDVIRRAVAEVAGPDGRRFFADMILKITGRINTLIAEAEAQRRGPRLQRLRSARTRIDPQFQQALRVAGRRQ